MRKIKVVFCSIILIVCCILFSNSVNAASIYTTKVVSSFNDSVKIYLNADAKEGYVTQSGWLSKKPAKAKRMLYKHSENYFAICTTFGIQNKDNSKTCQKSTTGWSSDNIVTSGVAAIILEASGGVNSNMSMVEYFNAELAINRYLNAVYDRKYFNSNRNFTNVGLNPSKIDSLKRIGLKATKAYNNFEGKKKKSMNIKLSPLKKEGNNYTTKVSFSGVKEKSTKYDEISINDPKIVDVKGGTATYSKDTKKITIVPNSGSTSISVKVNATVNRKYYVAQNYSCTGNQSVTLNKVVAKANKPRKLKASVAKTLPSTPPPTPGDSQGGSSQGSGSTESVITCDFMLYKVNTKGDPLTGSVFSLKSNDFPAEPKAFSDQSEQSEADEEEYPNGACIPLNNLTSLSYTETTAPVGYKKITSSGSVPSDKLTEGGEYDIENIPDTSLLIYKKDGDNNKKIAGAKLVLYQGDKLVKWEDTGTKDSNGNTVVKAREFVEISDSLTDEQIKQLEESASWTTTATGGMKFIELEYDEYTVEELSAPKNYIVNDEVKPITLTNDDNGRNKTLEVVDYLSTITISKQDITTQKELPGAKLRVVDSYGNNPCTIDNECNWTSSSKPHIITSLPDGVYYLEETTAPKGYELNTETIKFEVENGKAKSKIVMYNSLKKVTVADTLLKQKVIAYVIGSILIIVGVGVLVYEINKKKHS